jgi:hypothetical protein
MFFSWVDGSVISYARKMHGFVKRCVSGSAVVVLEGLDG